MCNVCTVRAFIHLQLDLVESGRVTNLLFSGNTDQLNVFGKWSNMAHAKIYFPEKNSILLVKLNKGSGEYSKIISERMKGTNTILVWSGD